MKHLTGTVVRVTVLSLGVVTRAVAAAVLWGRVAARATPVLGARAARERTRAPAGP